MDAVLADTIALSVNPLSLAGIVLVAGLLLGRLVFRKSLIGQFCCQVISFTFLTAMLAVDGISPFTPTVVTRISPSYLSTSLFKIIWWMAAAWLLTGLVRAVLVFKRQPKETRFLQDLCAGIIYIGAILSIVADVLDVPLGGLLAASGVAAIVLGLALQSTLGDVFSGIVLNLAKPYHPGDWISLDGGLEGRVVETNWRGTQLLTRTNDIATIPNSVISKAKLINASEPSGAHGVSITIRLDPAVLPLTSVTVLETAMLSCNLILRIPAAYVMVQSLDAIAMQCELTFFVPAIERSPDARNEVFDRVYRHCASAGIRLAGPPESSMVLPPAGRPRDATGVPIRLLERLPIFTPLSEAERSELASKMKHTTHKAGDILVEQGVVAGALFILTSGVLVGIRHAHGRDDEVLRYAPGDCFGQAGVLTGAASEFRVQSLTSSSVYEIARSDIQPLLKARPAIAAALGQIMARRQAAWRDRLVGLDEHNGDAETLAAQLSDRIRKFFGLKV